MTNLDSLIANMWGKYETEMRAQHLYIQEISSLLKIPRKVLDKTLTGIGSGLMGYWNSLAAGGWATLGPRFIGPRFESGTLVQSIRNIGFRTWISPAPVGSDVEIIIKKIDGKAGAKITFRVHGINGRALETKDINFSKRGDPETKTFTAKGKNFGFVSVTMSPHSNTPSNKFKYKIRYREIPQSTNTKRVSGIADLHIHQMAEYAFAGKWLHGSHTGTPREALCSCGDMAQELYDIMSPGDKDGMVDNVMHHGNGFPTFNDWPHHLDIGHQQVHESWLKDAHDKGLNLIVSCAVNNEPLALLLGGPLSQAPWRDMNNLKKQIRASQEFASKHSWCEVAHNPWHARDIIHAGKLAVILSVESSNIFPLDEGNIEDQLDELYVMGVRCIQIVHQQDNRFAGAAPQEPVVRLFQTIKRNISPAVIAETGFGTGFKFGSNGKNVMGLTTLGKTLVGMIMDRHMILDTSHYSVKALEDVYAIAKARNYYPLINTHTKFKTVLNTEERKTQQEYVTEDSQAHIFKETGGIVGLRTAPWANLKAPESKLNPDPQGSIGTSLSFAQQVIHSQTLGLNIAFGTDINGFTNQIGTRKKAGTNKPDAVSQEYWDKGLRHVGLLPDLVSDLSHLKVRGASKMARSAEAMLKSWERTWDKKRSQVKDHSFKVVSVKGVGSAEMLKIAQALAAAKKTESVKVVGSTKRISGIKKASGAKAITSVKKVSSVKKKASGVKGKGFKKRP